MSAQHTPGPRSVKVQVGPSRRSYTVHFAVDGSVSRVTYVNSVRGTTALMMNTRLARSAIAIAKATGGAK